MDDESAFNWCRFSAELGSLQAQYTLGYAYMSGRGTDKDYPKTIEWYTKAAERGHIKVQYDLGMILMEEGTEQNYTLAAYWLEKLSAQGYIKAKVELGKLYENGGVGVEKNYAKSIELYEEVTDSDSKGAN